MFGHFMIMVQKIKRKGANNIPNKGPTHPKRFKTEKRKLIE